MPSSSGLALLAATTLAVAAPAASWPSLGRGLLAAAGDAPKAAGAARASSPSPVVVFGELPVRPSGKHTYQTADQYIRASGKTEAQLAADVSHYDPPTAGCSALLASPSVAETEDLGGGKLRLWGPWTPWANMSVSLREWWEEESRAWVAGEREKKAVRSLSMAPACPAVFSIFGEAATSPLTRVAGRRPRSARLATPTPRESLGSVQCVCEKRGRVGATQRAGLPAHKEKSAPGDVRAACRAAAAGFPHSFPASLPHLKTQVTADTVYVRTFLTVKVLDPDSGGNNCLSVDTGFEHAAALFQPDNLPTKEAVTAARPPYCTWFGGKVNGTLCQQPFLRQYFDMPGAGSDFQPFKTAQLDWEPIGHAPAGEMRDEGRGERKRAGGFFSFFFHPSSARFAHTTNNPSIPTHPSPQASTPTPTLTTTCIIRLRKKWR
jgi:hypothetical protein